MSDESPLGIEIPADHVGAFVAEVFEDAERDTGWEDVVDAMVAPSAREDWASLEPGQQAVEVLRWARSYDEQAIEALESVPTDGTADPGDVEERFGEARRCRTNADTFRDGIAAAYADGRLDDEALIDAVETVGFDTEVVAEREQELERVANHFELDYQPYGGTLIQERESQPEGTAPETF